MPMLIDIPRLLAARFGAASAPSTRRMVAARTAKAVTERVSSGLLLVEVRCSVLVVNVCSWAGPGGPYGWCLLHPGGCAPACARLLKERSAFCEVLVSVGCRERGPADRVQASAWSVRGKSDREAGALPGAGAVSGECSVVRVHDGAGDGQSET